MNAQAARGVDRFGLVALVGAGTFAAHEVGYLVESGGGVSHAYLGVVGPLVVLVAGIASWLAAVQVLRGDSGRLPSLRALAAAQMGLYLVVEVAERVLAGSMASLASLPVALGLLAQLLVAWAALRLLGLGRDLLERFREEHPGPVGASLALGVPPVSVVVADPSSACLRLRGPPV